MILLGAGWGLVLWSILEYGLHRFVGHGGRGVWLEGFRVRHLLHHRDPTFFDPLHELVIGLGIAVLCVVALWSVLLGIPAGIGVGVGYGAGFLGYEALHRWVHSDLPVVFPVDRIRMHHLAHHRDPRGRYGITSTLWDAIWRTR